ncbi:agmatinase, mitochondrial-like, partial [Stegodyphus dumicola]|uniref:agmatinase, mitochondrial-like n=1 Tax=Stegodyphus dumicola TaxID=202533 RepID=UPI0015A80C0F
LDVGILGVPFDSGTSNRPGARFGPRRIRAESPLLNRCNASTGFEPFKHFQVADLGDIPVNIYDIPQAVRGIKKFISEVLSEGCTPLVMGGDHTITYPILQAMKEKYGPVGLIHLDAHLDFLDTLMGYKINHATPFMRAFEEGLLDVQRVVQIGMRSTCYSPEDYQKPVEKGFRVVLAEECWHISLKPLVEDIKKQMGDGHVYISIDIDALDPSFAPGTGTPEIAGLTTIQILEIIRGLKGSKIIGADLVEVSPPYDPVGNTALTAANLLFELLCSLPLKDQNSFRSFN